MADGRPLHLEDQRFAVNALSQKFRRLLEIALRDRAVMRHLPDEFGRAPVYASAEGGLKYVMKPMLSADPLLLAWAKLLVRPGSVVWDVGANIGVFSVAAANLAGPAGQVFAFEPDAFLVQLLRKTALRQPKSAATITIVPAAMAAATGLREFEIAARARASNALTGYGHSQMGGVRERQTVVALGIADCLSWLPPPGVMKIDVEGAEHELFAVGGRLLEHVRPRIACEVSSGNSRRMTQILKDARYRLFDADNLGSGLVETGEATANTIAVPAEDRHFAFPAAPP